MTQPKKMVLVCDSRRRAFAAEEQCLFRRQRMLMPVCSKLEQSVQAFVWSASRK